MCVNRTLVEDKMRRFKGECAQFSFNKCSICTHDGTSAKFSTNSQEMDNSAPIKFLNNRSHGQNNSSTSGEAKFVSQ